MRIFWRAVRITKWSALALFLFFCAFAPWGWTVTATTAAIIITWKVRERLEQPPGRHAAGHAGRHAA